MKAVGAIATGLVLLGISLSFDSQALSQSPTPLPVPKEMADQVSADTGQPVILQDRGSLLWGASSKTVFYGQPVPVLLWLYNPTSEPQPVLTCTDISRFWSRGTSVLNSSGKRVLTLTELRVQQQAPDPSHFIVESEDCASNVLFEIPPHTVMHGNFSKLEGLLALDLRTVYSLSPGRYALALSELDQNGRRTMKPLSNAQNRLQIEINEP